MSTRQRKLKTRLFLQKNLAAHPNFPDRYPLYVYINFLGQNTKLSITENGRAIYWDEKLLEDFNNGVRIGVNFSDLDRIENKLTIIEKVLRYEHGVSPNGYSLKGLRERIDFYEQDMTELILHRVRELLYLEFKCINTDKDISVDSSIAIIYATIKMEQEDFFPSILVRTYLELYVTLWLFSQGFGSENMPSLYDRMLINWLCDSTMFSRFQAFVEQHGGDAIPLFDEVQKMRGLSKTQIDFIKAFLPRIEQLKAYFLLLKREEG